jgi:hypothetical protein
MFAGATSFAHSLKAWAPTVGNLWDVDMMFFGALSYYDDLSSWSLCNLVSIPAAFADPFKVVFPRACACSFP